MTAPEQDQLWMNRALRLARRGEGKTSPNPMVGAVVVRAGRLVGAGYHRACGSAHAEVEALKQAGTRARGATLYVSLEPCNHHGRTPPCVDAIIAAGIRTVVYAMRDPNPRVTGGGARALRRQGVEVRLGPGGDKAQELNRSYLVHVSTGRPLVLWKVAASLDGRIATESGQSQWITGAASRRMGQRLRRWADAVMVGSGTVLADNPRLTVRDGGPRKPLLRAVLDGRLRTPADAVLLGARNCGPVILYTRTDPQHPRARALSRAGAEVVSLPAKKGGGVDLDAALRDVGRRGIGRLLIEGGGQTAAALVRSGLVDRFVVFLAPMLLGGDAVAALGPLMLEGLGAAPKLVVERVSRSGSDIVVEGRFNR